MSHPQRALCGVRMVTKGMYGVGIVTIAILQCGHGESATKDTVWYGKSHNRHGVGKVSYKGHRMSGDSKPQRA